MNVMNHTAATTWPRRAGGCPRRGGEQGKSEQSEDLTVEANVVVAAVEETQSPPRKATSMRKVLILGSGALKIGEAGEFDYSGSQCLKALKEEGIETVLINPNIATIQTSKDIADKVYFLPVTTQFVEKVIAKEKPDGILLAFGGQTALNCGVGLHKAGIFERYNIKVLGTPISAIVDTEDRELFVKRLMEINLKTPDSIPAITVNDALAAAQIIRYPVIIRAAYSLGGKGSGVCYDDQQLQETAEKALTTSPQIIVEEYLNGWKEIEYEVVRDCYDNCITVCNMENFDPLGIHTGDSIVVAPSQTLTNSEYHKLRQISIQVIRHLGIIGECNIQFALHPASEDYRIIEVNARLSRSSALASKATGYPLAFIAAKLALGYGLFELQNQITKKTMACFEPALDYCVVKIPRWDLQKFINVSVEIGTSMKSVGEVMAIGRKFEEALQKAVRMLDIGHDGLCETGLKFDDIEKAVKVPTDKRLYALAQALEQGMPVDKINNLCHIDKWFLYKLKNIVDIKNALKVNTPATLSEELLKKAKQYGFSDRQIGKLTGTGEMSIRELRKKRRIFPKVNQIDTLAAEFPAQTNYLYLTYNAEADDIHFFHGQKNIIVLGSGAYRIGSSVEFDWCCVNAVFSLKKMGYQTTMINYNPETVSTDYDICDRLYFEELSFETVADIYEKENPYGVIVSMGGQIPNNLALKCHTYGMKILGSSPMSIDNAENRHKFSQLCDELGVDQPEWKELTDVDDVEEFAQIAGYPVLIRPSYVLSGAAMRIVFDREDLELYLHKAAMVSPEHPVVISKFILNAKELEIDAVADQGDVVMHAISEHVENAGVHSGDATMIFPPKNVYLETIRSMEAIAKKVAKRLQITGPFNIQFLAKDNKLMVIELNLRASRSFPFVSKVSNHNFIDVATKAIMGKLEKKAYATMDLGYYGIKTAQFSFSRLHGADPVSSVEMASTGEVACIGTDANDAFLKSLLSVGFELPKKRRVLISISGDKNRYRFIESAKKLSSLGFSIFATAHTAEFFKAHGIATSLLHKASEKISPNVLDCLQKRKLDLVINIPNPEEKDNSYDMYLIRRLTVDFSIPLFTNMQVAKLFIDSIEKIPDDTLEIKEWGEYKL